MDETQNSNLGEFFKKDVLAESWSDLARRRVLRRFQNFPIEPASDADFVVFNKFLSPPHCYWDFQLLLKALKILINDYDRSEQSILFHNERLNASIESFFKMSKVLGYEQSLDHNNSKDLLMLSTEFHPEYLRIAEHIYGNILSVFWSVLKPGSIESKYVPKNAVNWLRQKNKEEITTGYSDRVRNAIAHGQVKYRGLHIEYGTNNPKTLTVLDFLALFDDLWRTTASLTFALILFYSQFKEQLIRRSAPLSIISLFSNAAFEKPGHSIDGCMESYVPRTGKQLHIAVSISTLHRTRVLGECARIATILLKNGALDYDRFLITLDHGKSINSLSIVKPKILTELIESRVPLSELPRAFDETQLLWHNESFFISKVKMRITFLKIGLSQANLQMHQSWWDSGIALSKGRYLIKKIENVSGRGYARLKVYVVLHSPLDAGNQEILNLICYDVTKRMRRRLVNSRPSSLEKHIPFFRTPRHVVVSVYQEDRPFRSITSGGWPGGNLVALSERIWGDNKFRQIKRPEVIFKKLNIRYSIDADEMKEVNIRFNELFEKMNK